MTTPWMLFSAALLITVSYGLMRRPRWMWYFGWVIFYFVAGGLGNFWMNALFSAPDRRSVVFAGVFFLGGLLAWLPWVLHWISVKPTFGRATPPKKAD